MSEKYNNRSIDIEYTRSDFDFSFSFSFYRVSDPFGFFMLPSSYSDETSFEEDRLDELTGEIVF